MSKEVILSGLTLDAIAVFHALKSYTFPFRSRISPRLRVITPIVGESMTKQSFRNECDVNNILSAYQKTGIMPHVTSKPASYLDVSDFNPDYLNTMNIVLEAGDTFSQLPSLLRKRFQNDPLNFLQFVSDPSNRDEMSKLGLLNPGAEAGAGSAPGSASGAAAGGSSEPGQ